MRGVTVMGVNIPLTIEFQPALPMRGVTSNNRAYVELADFNPHSPCGE